LVASRFKNSLQSPRERLEFSRHEKKPAVTSDLWKEGEKLLSSYLVLFPFTTYQEGEKISRKEKGEKRFLRPESKKTSGEI